MSGHDVVDCKGIGTEHSGLAILLNVEFSV